MRSSSASDTADTPSGPAAASAGETASAAPGEGEGQPHRALVTGGSRGVGLAIALRLAADGWHTTVAGRDEETLKQAADTALERGLLLHTARADVTDETSVRQLFAEVTADGPLRLCVNNAGANSAQLLVKPSKEPGGEARRYPLEKWEDTLRLCLTGVFLSGREAAAAMVEAEVPGVIVNVSSASRHGAYGQSGYTAAKSGVDALTRTWSLELARYGIRVVGVAPGVIDSEALRRHSANDPRHAAYMERLQGRVPLRRWASVEEVADAVSFAAGNGYLTGTTLEVDGGGLPDQV